MSGVSAMAPTSGASAILEGSPGVMLSAAGTAAAEHAISSETRRAYGRALRQVAEQLADRPMDDEGLSEALSELAADGAGRAKLGQIVAALRFGARVAGRPDPVGPSCDVVLRAHRRATSPSRQVAAVDWDQADAAASAVASTGDLRGLRSAAIIATMSDALLRVSEVAALQVGDIEPRSDGASTLTVRRSKTDQDGDGATLYLGGPTTRRVDTWKEAAGLAGADMTGGPLFRRILRGQHASAEPLSPRSIREIVRSAAAAVGIEGASGHSLRIGSAMSLVRAGASLVETQQAGRWVSPSMPAHYARNEIVARGAVARLRYHAERM
ncbi:MAG: tyrosine-type recombinase/integrase [Acidimicrobiales bacterium]|nr:tyrosine-type recombinase/integrase [Acidimicrobiales bacterium]MXY02658.1 tyrosine-type recombinase/integrase [Acidimicrobiales bacterium]MYG89428.1 tyrosine-type recombinase/integrase [Acidimicrobiales bacterium]MYI27931.1 tyrosine-type recombinase/integrase [Acidimicrobiales bacterium]